MANATVSDALAFAMELSADDRATLARWLARCNAAGLSLTPESVRRAGDSAMRELLGGQPA